MWFAGKGVKMNKQQSRRASCSECPGTYELVPPPDSTYNEPKESLWAKKTKETQTGTPLLLIFYLDHPF
jgi:hypothetical protein